MASDLADRAKHLFHEALEQPDAERAAFLAERCHSDAALQHEVKSLLRAHASLAPEPESKGEHAGDVIGHYKLLQEIGEGGFGTVWMAEQHEPVRRKVALKILKWGMDTAQVVARFEAERQALALMDHENIAKVFDGGATEQGRPYFVMELVRGVRITEYCDAIDLTLAERLELFVDVCHAVQHAHHKGVIHRDLKPSNVLVTVHDGTPVPKVIDFGIAKATSAELTQKTVFTEFQQMIGTPEYMAPEQAEVSALDVDTRADVYSLGVLLYELLTGSTPFRRAELLKAGYGEMLRQIREVEPPTPSTRVAALGEQLFDVARHRGAQPKSFGAALRGELDWIVMKALDKDRNRRYPTAAAFADDVERSLRNEPVLAGPPSRLYRWRKYVRRHRVGVLAGALVTASLVTGLALASWGYLEASEQTQLARTAEGEATTQKNAAIAAEAEERTQRELAEARERDARTQAKKAETVISLLQQMLSSSDPHETKGRDYTVRQLLDDFDRDLRSGLASEPEVEVAVRRTIGRSYLGLGLVDQAEPQLTAALALAEATFGEDSAEFAHGLVDWAKFLHDRGDYRQSEEFIRRAIERYRATTGDNTRELAIALRAHSELLRHLARLDDAEDAARAALALHEELFDGDDPAVAHALGDLALVLSDKGPFDEAARCYREALEIKRRHWGDEHPNVASTLNNLGEVLSSLGELDEAERCYEESLAINSLLHGAEHSAIATNLNNLAMLHYQRGELGEAEELLRPALKMTRKVRGDEHPDVPVLLGNLAMILRAKGEFAAAEGHLQDALAILREHRGNDDPEVANKLEVLADVLLQQGKLDEAAQVYRQLLQRPRDSRHANDRDLATWQWLYNLGSVLRDKNELDEAEQRFKESIALRREQHPEPNSEVVKSLNGLIDVLSRKGDFESAARYAWELLSMVRELRGEDHIDVVRTMDNLGLISRRLEDFAVAEQLAREALPIRSVLFGERSAEVAVGHRNLAGPLRRQGDFSGAEEHLRTALAIQREVFGDDHPQVASSLALLTDLLMSQDKAGAAEPFARECVEIRARHMSQTWLLANAQSLLGDSLLAQGKFAEAEPLLLEGYETMTPPSQFAFRKRGALERVVRLYEAWGKPEQVKEWRAKLDK